MTLTTVDKVARELKGQSLHLPSLFDFYSRWPNEVSPHHAQLRETMEVKIQEWIPDEPVRCKARKVNLPLFSATYVIISTGHLT